jgi:hypothetical protein
MVALLQRLGLLSPPPPCDEVVIRGRDAVGSYPGELTKDQVSYLHEVADERRRVWKEHDRTLAAKREAC